MKKHQPRSLPYFYCLTPLLIVAGLSFCLIRFHPPSLSASSISPDAKLSPTGAKPSFFASILRRFQTPPPSPSSPHAAKLSFERAIWYAQCRQYREAYKLFREIEATPEVTQVQDSFLASASGREPLSRPPSV